MATSGTNYTAKWNLQNGILTISPVSGNSGIMRYGASDSAYVTLDDYITLTDDEWASVTKIKFVSSVRFQVNKGFMSIEYVAKSSFGWFFQKALNVTQIDVTGLNITGATNVQSLFALKNLTEITGLANLDVSNCTNFRNMFYGTKITSLDISAFSANALNNADSVYGMFMDMDYCNSIKLPANFQRTFSEIIYDAVYYFGIASSGVTATKDEVTISSDEDFFKLTATSQGGTWIRDISGSTELKFNVNKVVRDGNSAEMQYTYYASSATVEVYLKETSQSSFPLTPSDTFSIEGIGTGNMTLTLSSDSAYDVMVKVYDGETTLYTYPSIDSNVLLFSVDDKGRVECGDNQGTRTALLDLIHPVGSYYWTSDGNFVPADVFGGTWEKIDAGVTLVSAGTDYTVRSGTAKDGGSADAIVPYHRHSVSEQSTGNMSANSSHSHDFSYAQYQRGTGSATASALQYTGSTKTTSTESVQHTHKVPSHNTNYAGTSGNTTGANMPPYKCAYCWHRTA